MSVTYTNVTNQRTITLSIHITELLSIKRTDCIFIYNCYQYENKYISLVPSQYTQKMRYLLLNMSRVD